MSDLKVRAPKETRFLQGLKPNDDVLVRGGRSLHLLKAAIIRSWQSWLLSRWWVRLNFGPYCRDQENSS
jgi:hypothetical protein